MSNSQHSRGRHPSTPPTHTTQIDQLLSTLSGATSPDQKTAAIEDVIRHMRSWLEDRVHKALRKEHTLKAHMMTDDLISKLEEQMFYSLNSDRPPGSAQQLHSWAQMTINTLLVDEAKYFRAGKRDVSRIKKKGDRRNVPSKDSTLAQQPAPGPSPSSDAAKAELSELAKLEIQSLPDHDRTRTIVSLHIMVKLSFAAIAKQLNLPQSTVRDRFCRGHAQLQAAMKRHNANT